MRPVGDDELEKNVEIGTLYAFYGALLTPRQRDALRLHYEEDLSLGEIAEELGVSRQNVHELITRSADKLKKYESALGGAAHASETAKSLRQALALLRAAREDKSRLGEAETLIKQVIRQQEGEEPWPLRDSAKNCPARFPN